MSANKRPNFLFIVADQWRGDCIGCAEPHHPVMTPHVNQLAAEGTRFVNAFADCPVCMPQRITHLTGQVAGRFGKTGNWYGRVDLDVSRTLPSRLSREAGYQTQSVGKMHFFPSRARFGFDNVVLHPNDYAMWLEEQGLGGMYRGHGLGGNEVYPAVSAVPERCTHTHWVVDEAIRFLYRRDPECPFLLYVVFEAPHSPFDPPEPYDRMYDRISVPPPVRGEWLDGDAAPPEFRARPLMCKYEDLSDEMIAESRRRYYGQVSHIDYQLGRLLGELATRGLYDDTVIVFTADHGEHLGDHGIWGKTTFLRGSGDVPLIVRTPSWMPGGPNARVDAAALTADICPTFLEMAGLPAEADTDGVSMADSLTSRPGAGERIVCGECGDKAFATDSVHKFCYYAGGGIEQLFDVRADPYDLRDLSGDAGRAEAMETLRAALIEHLARLDRPLVSEGRLLSKDIQIDEDALRGRNPAAWRGPMRYGQGYYGWDG